MENLEQNKTYYCTHRDNIYELKLVENIWTIKCIWNYELKNTFPVTTMEKNLKITSQILSEKIYYGSTIRQAMRKISIIKSAEDKTPFLYKSIEQLTENNIDIFL